MNKKKKIIIISAAVMLIIAAAGFFVWFSFNRQDPDAFRLNIYYFNPVTVRLESTAHILPPGEENEWPEMAVNHFVENSQIPSFTGVWQGEERFITGWRMENDVFCAEFPHEYNHLPPLEEAMFRAAFVWTMTGLPFVNSVQFSVEGADSVTLESRRTVVIDPVISSIRLTTRTFTLFFVNAEHDALVPEVFTSSTVDMDQVEKYILTQLIEGPVNEDLVAVIPPETKIIDIVTEEYTCYVNLSNEFVNRFSGSTSAARLMVYSIVNTLTENLSHVRRVQFLIDSERVDQLHGLTDFHQAFEQDETLHIGYVPPIIEEETEE
jgi:germination protein M